MDYASLPIAATTRPKAFATCAAFSLVRINRTPSSCPQGTSPRQKITWFMPRFSSLPTVVTGRGNGLFHLGRHIKFPNETPLANLHLMMMHQMGVPAEAFADSNGKLRELTEL